MAGKKKNIFFVKDIRSNPKFITNDLLILQKNNNVILNNVRITKNFFIIFGLASQFLKILLNIFRTDIFYIWFADYHSFLPVCFSKLFNKRSVICAGGYEATYIPEINCGIFTKSTLTKKIRNFFAVYSLKNCDYILPVDESLIYHENKYIYSDKNPPEIFKDGIKHFIPDIKANIKTTYLSYDPEYFKKPDNIKKENIVLSAGLIPNEYEIKRKGYDLLFESAKILTDIRFILIGFDKEYIKQFSHLNLPNLTLETIIPYDKLVEYYSRAKVFAQISMFEGMPSTLCEAMLCECIPVGSSVNAIPGIIGDTGFIIEKKDINEVTEKLKMAINSDELMGMNARKRIIERFPFSKRENEIDKIINNASFK